MSEFVCELTDTRYEMDWTPKEEIVRCKDCTHYELNGLGQGFCVWKYYTNWECEPDGFCAWGERKR